MLSDEYAECTHVTVQHHQELGSLDGIRALADIPSSVARMIFAQGTVSYCSELAPARAVHSNDGKDGLVILGALPNGIRAKLTVETTNRETGRKSLHCLWSQANQRQITIKVQKSELVMADGGRRRCEESEILTTKIGARLAVGDVLSTRLAKEITREPWNRMGSTKWRDLVSLPLPDGVVDCDGREISALSIACVCEANPWEPR
jgi:hypothetical protein